MTLAFLRRLVPACFGLLNYATIRLLNDTISGMRFWERPWGLNLFEVLVSLVLGYAIVGTCHKLLAYLDRRWPPVPGRPHRLGREVLLLIGLTLGLVNCTFIPMAAYTDDGLSWGDVATINTIPLLYTLVYYGWVRSRHFLRAALHQQLQVERAAHEHARTELQFLRAQYHPHFLFNALNTVYFQMDEDVAAAKHSLEQLSELLRYQLYDQQQPVRLARELQYLHSYLALQRVRRAGQLRLTVDVDPRLGPQQLYPLLLLPLLENAFKYAGPPYAISVRADLTPAGLAFEVRNSVAELPAPAPAVAAGGLGLGNLRRRLELLYPGRHRLYTARQVPYFVAQLTLPLLP